MNIVIHQTHHSVADFNNIFKYLDEISEDGIHIFPELFLTGYPLQDLCLQKSFIESYQAFLSKLKKWAKSLPESRTFLVGGLEYKVSNTGLPIEIKNNVIEISKNRFESIYTKQLLPNYDIFDEQKYFSAGASSYVWEYQNKKVGILICEDMWASTFYQKDPVNSLSEYIDSKNIELDLIVNLSASPYILDKSDKRLERAKFIARSFKCPFIYSNRVGGEDEILFDGQSFVCDGEKTILQAKKFEKDTLKYSLDKFEYSFAGALDTKEERTWESLFSARISSDGNLPLLSKWSDDQCQEVCDALMFGFQEYASKCGFNNFTVALSGGMDSALVLALMRLSLKEGQYLEAIYMPSVHSSPISYDLSLELSKKLGIKFSTLPIKFLHSATKNLFGDTFSQPFEGLTDENIQSRLRGTLLYTRSNQINSMVVNTSNKSELAVGYSTQYGDSVGAISMLGDLFKSEVYQIANFINKKYNNLIPEKIITRPPTAELRTGQVDSESLPPYERLDAILEGILSYRYTKKELIEAGFSSEEVTKVIDLYRKTEYKRYQFCPIIKISSKSFGFGYRVPISKSSTFYND
jgi:NAD+ synthase (glutamine-hydrolysing)